MGQFINSQASGTNFSTPDICNTIVGTATSPITYPNTSNCNAATGGSTSVLISNQSAHGASATVSSSTGDEAGTCGGIISGVFANATQWTSFSAAVMISSQCAIRFGDVTAQNNMNCVGATTVASQYAVTAG